MGDVLKSRMVETPVFSDAWYRQAQEVQVTDANFGISTAGSDDDAAWQLNAHHIMQLPTNPCSTYQKQVELEVGCD